MVVTLLTFRPQAGVLRPSGGAVGHLRCSRHCRRSWLEVVKYLHTSVEVSKLGVYVSFGGAPRRAGVGAVPITRQHAGSRPSERAFAELLAPPIQGPGRSFSESVSGYPGGGSGAGDGKFQLDRPRHLRLPEQATIRELIRDHAMIVDAL